jgi:hypothetical protein
MLSGAGEPVAEERLEEEGEGYARCLSERETSLESADISESDISVKSEAAEEGTALSGELGS